MSEEHGTDRGPAQVRSYVAGLAVLAAGCGVAIGVQAPYATPSPFTVAGLLLVLTAAEYLVVRFHYRGEIMALSLFEAVLAPAIFVLPPVFVVLLAAAAQIAAASGHRLPAVKLTFNAAQWVIGASAATATFHGLGGGGVISGRSLSALASAMIVLIAVNALAFTIVIRIADRRPLFEVARDLVPTILLGGLVNAGFGLLFVTAFSRSPWAVALLLVPLIALHAASRSVAASVADQRRLGAMHGTLLSLAAPTTPEEAIPRFLDGVRDCFGAASVELLLRRDGGDVIHATTADGSSSVASATERSMPALLIEITEAIRVTAEGSDAASVMLARAGRRHCLAAPLFVEGRTAGVLCVFDSTGYEGFELGELAVLQALAGEAAAMIQRATLIGEVLEERRKLSEVIDSTSDGIVTLGADGVIHLWNPGMEAITGYRAADMTAAAGFGLLLPVDGGDRSPISFTRWASWDSLPPEAIDVTSADGEARSLLCSYTPVRTPDGEPSLLIIVARDVTRVRELEALKEDFVATVSHELRSPLTSIRGWSQLLLGRDETDVVDRQALEAIVRQADQLEHVVDDLLEVARVERGAHDPRESAVDLTALARVIVDDARVAYPDRQIHLDIPTDACIARGDAMWVERIVCNLVSNAVRYTPASKPILVLVDRTEDVARIDVVDHGPGILAADQGRIFERFARLGGPDTRLVGGTGLGLYIARRLAASMGGTLTVSSEPGVQTVFTLQLPAVPALIAVR